MSINSKTRANLPVGSSYKTSNNLTIFGCGLDGGHNFFKA